MSVIKSTTFKFLSLHLLFPSSPAAFRLKGASHVSKPLNLVSAGSEKSMGRMNGATSVGDGTFVAPFPVSFVSTTRHK